MHTSEATNVIYLKDSFHNVYGSKILQEPNPTNFVFLMEAAAIDVTLPHPAQLASQPAKLQQPTGRLVIALAQLGGEEEGDGGAKGREGGGGMGRGRDRGRERERERERVRGERGKRERWREREGESRRDGGGREGQREGERETGRETKREREKERE